MEAAERRNRNEADNAQRGNDQRQGAVIISSIFPNPRPHLCIQRFGGDGPIAGFDNNAVCA